MRSPQLSLALVLLCLVGGGSYLLLKGSGDEPRGDKALERSTALEPGVEPSHTELADTPLADGLDAAPASTERTAAAPSETEEREASITERTIAGRVVDEFGAPVTDARVFVAPATSWTGVHIDRIADSSRVFAQVIQTQTGQVGEYRFESSLRGDLKFAVRSKGFAPLRTSRAVEGAGQAEVESFPKRASRPTGSCIGRGPVTGRRGS